MIRPAHWPNLDSALWFIRRRMAWAQQAMAQELVRQIERTWRP